MKVYEIREIARTWVQDRFADRPDFVGAHLMGGINELRPDEEFPSFSDVDMNIVFEGEGARWPEEMQYRGLMLEFGIRSVDDYRSVETLITNPSIAPNLFVDSILVDPHHILTKAHSFIAREFTRRRWVRARCEDEKQKRIEPYIPKMTLDTPGMDLAFYNLWSICTYLAGYVALANLVRPTHRKAFIRAKEILEEKQAPQLHSALLEFFGCAGWDRAQVESCLKEAAAAFDLAVQIHKTPHFADFKLKPYLRPYFVEASEDMIARDFYREAVPWIMTYYTISVLTIEIEGSDEDKEVFVDNGCRLMMRNLGLSSAEDWAERAVQARQLADSIYQFCDDTISAYPD